MLSHCKDQEIYHTLTAEIMENVNKLSADKFGNYVVQQLVEHGGHAMVSTMARQFAGRVVSMSYHKFSSNVVEKCLTFGSREVRQLIADEIVGAGGGEHFDHLVVGDLLYAWSFPLFDFIQVQCALFVILYMLHVQDMMINPYANFVIQKMMVTAEEHQVELLLDLASSNATSLARYPHGRHVIDAMEKFLGAAKGVCADPARRRR